MINELQLGNFKAFAGRQTVPIRPITLLFGTNSAGKSSVIHGLMLGRRVVKHGEFEKDIEAGGIDIGGFAQYVHRSNTASSIEWGVTMETSRMEDCVKGTFGECRSVSLNFELGDFSGVLGVQRITIKTDDTLLLDMEVAHPTGAGGFNPRERQTRVPLDGRDYGFWTKSGAMTFWVHGVNVLHPGVRAWFDNAFKRFGKLRLTERHHRYLGKHAEELFDHYTCVERLLPEGLEQKPIPMERHPLRGKITEVGKPFRVFAREVAANYLDQLFTGLYWAFEHEFTRVGYLGPFRSYPPRRMFSSQELAGGPDGSSAWSTLAFDEEARDKINRWLGDTSKLNSSYQVIVRNWLNMSAATPEMARKLARQKSHQTSRVEAGLQKMVQEFSTSRDLVLREILLSDQRSKTVVSHRDVGVGISQILPILVSSFATSNHLHAIEQPELHLHPKLQAELGDLFIESALGETKNRLLLETHSEHLLLRIMRRIRETSCGRLAKGSIPVKPSDVSVLYVEPDGARSIVREMPLNERGELIKAWPGGFFEEGLRETFA